jgi:hypothetical protein
MPHLISANRLDDGIVVFYAGPSQWREFIDHALVLASQNDIEAALTYAAQDVAANKIVEPYTFDVSMKGGKITPTHLREQIRALGPSVHRDHGKQAQSPEQTHV